MRRIDGDALIETLQKRSDELTEEKQPELAGALMGAICYVHDAPTIEPRRGEWVTARTMQHDGETYCSACGEEPYRKSDRHMPNFCPSCGTDMGREG